MRAWAWALLVCGLVVSSYGVAWGDSITLEFDVDITYEFGGFVGGPDVATLSLTFDTEMEITLESDQKSVGKGRG